MCQMKEETTEHILCRCEKEEAARFQIHPGGQFTLSMLVTHPEECRKLLERRFKDLKLPPKETGEEDDEVIDNG